MNKTDPCFKWFEMAQEDLGAAEFLLDMYPRPIEIICYHCEQAAEKMLKGILVANNIEPPKTHDLMVLCRRCGEIDSAYEELMDNCVDLTPYGVQVRYPYELELFESDMLRAIQMCRELCDVVELKMGIQQVPEEKPDFGEMQFS